MTEFKRAALFSLGLLAMASSMSAQASGGSIGVILPESWPSKAQAEEIRNGMQLALKTWPSQPVPTLIVKDSGCDPRKAEAATKALIEARVDVVLGNWCEIGGGAELLRNAGIGFVSSNAERVKGLEGSQLQLGRVELYAGEKLAAKLRSETGLRVSARTSCWMDFEPSISDKYDAVLCPVLAIDKARWDQVAATYSAGFLKPFTVSVARGYAAMEVALSYVRRLRGGAKSGAALKDTQSISTLFGPLPAPDGATPAEAMQLVFAAKLPKLAPKQAAAVDEIVKSKGCGGKAAGAHSGPWAEQPFVVRGTGAAADCAAPIVTAQR